MKHAPFSILLIGLLLAGLCPSMIPAQNAPDPTADNPFFKPYDTPFQVPPFQRIKVEHFLPAVQEAIRQNQAEIDAIANNPEPPTFANTMEAMDRAGRMLGEVMAVFGALQGADTTPALQDLARRMTPITAAHRDNIRFNEKLFARIKSLYDRRAELKLSPEQLFVLENSYRGFVRSGALLDAAQKEKMRQLNQQLALLGLKFGENLLAETNSSRIVIDNPADLAGLPPAAVDMGAETAKQLNMPGKWVYTTQVPSMTPFLQYSSRRDLREQLHRAYFTRGDRGNANDNKEIIRQIIALRHERAKLLGYPTFAHFALEDNMAKTPDTVNTFLRKLWDPALARAKSEAAEMQAIIDREKGGFTLSSWDWWYYAEKLRKEKYDLDDTALRPYFQLENVRKGIFTLCEKLYGIRFIEHKELPIYNPEVQVYEVQEADGRHIGLLYMDFHPRPGKRGGAWSGGLRGAHYENGKRVPPISTIVCNFTRATSDAPSLLSLDEVRTFFHEFGHALSTLFHDTRYRGGNVAQDSVELPSQIMENWAQRPELLKLYAFHYKTGKVIPDELITKIRNSELFNQGFVTVEYLAASILDMALHANTEIAKADIAAFEAETMKSFGLIPAIVPRYRIPYFNHIVGGYAAGYYSYIWSGVLDSDAFEAFKEKGLFDKATAASFRRHVLEKFGSEDAMTMYKRFRGAEPKIEPLLRKRGLLPETPTAKK